MKTNLNRKGFCLLFSLFLLAGGGGLYASDYHSMSQVQDNVISVSGTVKDTKGEPLIGVSVLVKGTTNGTVTDLDGKFTLKVSAGDILEFSYIGYASQSVTVTNANSLNITLSEDTPAEDCPLSCSCQAASCAVYALLFPLFSYNSPSPDVIFQDRLLH